MSDKRYPTRMHEVLGVETGEVFTVTWNDTKKDFSLDGFGIPEDIETAGIDELRYPASGPDVVYMVNHPERITRRPRLTEEQVAMLKAAWALGARYIAREGNSGLRLSDNAPIVLMGGRLKIADDSLTMYIESYSNPLVELVKQSDPAPLDIVQVLRQNGVEVEP